MMHRRQLITGLVSLLAAPAIVRAGSLMPVKLMLDPDPIVGQGTYVLDAGPAIQNNDGAVRIIKYVVRVVRRQSGSFEMFGPEFTSDNLDEMGWPYLKPNDWPTVAPSSTQAQIIDVALDTLDRT